MLVALLSTMLFAGAVKIDQKEAKSMMDKGSVTVVDVRTPEEYASGHIKGAINIPVETIDKRPAALPDLNAKILLYCRTGRRSAAAAKTLSDLGYRNVYDFGGITTWPYGTVINETATRGILSSFSAVDLDGRTQSEQLLKGKKLTMVFVWGTYCGYCRQEMPAFQSLQEKYPDFQVLGIIADATDRSGKANARQVKKAKQIMSTAGLNALTLLPSPDFASIMNSASALPFSFFVDENGAQVGTGYFGARSEEAWEQVITRLLK